MRGANSPFVSRKILAHVPTLAKYLDGSHYPPIQVEIDLTNICTSACPWCAGFLEREKSRAVLLATGDTADERWGSSKGRVNRLLDELFEVGVKSVTWTGGGDPTCHRHWFDFVKFSNWLGMENGLITNGVIDVSHAVSKCTWIRFSVDAATEENYGRQHGRAFHFPKVIENVTRAAEAARGTGCTIGVAMVTGDQTRDEIVPFAEMWRDIPVDYIQYRPLQDTHGKAWFSDRPETMELIRQAERIDSRVTWSEPKYQALVDGLPGKTERCHGIFFETAIAADGHVYTCCHLKGNRQYSIGNLHDESFATIWRRHLAKRQFVVTDDCPAFCRHYGTNEFVELEVLKPVKHENFI